MPVEIAELSTVFRADLSDLQAKSKQAQEITTQTAKAMNSSLGGGGQAAERSLISLGGGVDALRNKTQALSSSMMAFGGTMTLVSAPLGLIAGLAIKTGISFDSLKQQAMIAFTTMLGGADQAKAMLENLTNFAATTPFTLTGLIPLTQQLIAFGFKGQEIIPMLTSIGDAISGLGRGEPEMQRMILNLGQIKAAGHVTGREIRDMSTLGINALQILADSFGKTTDEMQEMISKGLVPADVGIKAIVEGLEKGTKNTIAFGGMMAAQSHTLVGIMSNLKDTADKTLGAIFQPLVDRVTPALENLQLKLAEFGKAVERIGLLAALSQFTGLSEAFLKVAAAIGAIILVAGPLTFAIGLLAAAVGALLSPIGLVVIAIASFATAYASNFGGIRDTVDRVVGNINTALEQNKTKLQEVVDKVASSAAGYLAALDKLGSGVSAAFDRMPGLFTNHQSLWTRLIEGLGVSISLYFDKLTEFTNFLTKLIDDWSAVFEHLFFAMWKGITGDAHGSMTELGEVVRIGLASVLETLDSFMPVWLSRLTGFGEAASRLRRQFGAISTVPELSGQLGTLKIDDATIAGWKQFQDSVSGSAFKIGEVAKASSAATVTTRAHAKAAGAAKSAVSEYAEGVIGLNKAFNTVVASLQGGQFSKLFDDLPVKARQGLDKLKQAASVIIKELENIFKHITPTGAFRFSIEDKDLKPTLAGLEAFGAAGIEQFRKISIAVQVVQEELTKLKFRALDLAKPVFEIPFTAMYDSMGRVTEAGKKMADAIEKAGGVIKLTFTQVAADVKEPLNATEGVMEHLSDAWLKSLGKLKVAFDEASEQPPHWAGAVVDAAARVKKAMGDSANLIRAKAELDIRASLDSAIDTFARLGKQAGKTGNDLIQFVIRGIGALKDGIGSSSEAQKALADFAAEINRLPGALNNAIDRMLKALDKWSIQAVTKVKGTIGGILQVFDAIPGKLRNSAQSFIDWVNRIDQILGGLHKIFKGIPDGLGGLITSIINIFKGTSTAAATAASASSAAAQVAAASAAEAAAVSTASAQIVTAEQAIGTAAQQAASQVESAANRAGVAWQNAKTDISKSNAQTASSFGKLATGIIGALGGISMVANVFGSGMGRVKGGIQGALGGAVAGASIGFMVGGPVGAGIGALIGGGAGLIAGIFGGGKTALQKAQEAAQLQQARDAIKLSQQQVLQAAEQTKQSMLETASKIKDLLESITFYTAVPKEAFKAFFRDLDKVMRAFADRAKEWLGDSSGKIKIFAEDMKTIMEGIAAAPSVLVSIGKYLGIPQSSIDKFFVDLGRVIEAFSVLSENFTRKFLRHVRQFAERIGPATELISGIATGIKDMFDLKAIPTISFDIWQQALQEIVTRLGQLAEYFDKFVTKEIGFFAEKVAPGVALWKDSVETIKSMVDIPVPTQADFDNLFGSIRSALEGMVKLAETMNTEALGKAQSIAEASLSIFAAIKAAVEALGGLRDYKLIASETFQAVSDDFDRALDLMTRLINRSESFIAMSKTFEENMRIGASHLKSAIDIFLAAIKNLGYGLAQFGIQITVPSGAIGSSGDALRLAPTGFISTSSSTTTHVTIQTGNVSVSASDPNDRVKLRAMIALWPELAGVLGQYD